MTDYNPYTQFVDPYGETESETDVPTSPITDPWSNLSAPEGGRDVQAEATAPTTDPYAVQGYGEYRDPGAASKGYINNTQKIGVQGGGRKPNWERAVATQLGVSGAIYAAGAYYGGAAQSAAYQAALADATASGAGETAATETATRMSAEGSSGAWGNVGAGVAGGVAGYQMSPYGAMFEREYLGSYSPGYLAAPVASSPLAMGGARSDNEAQMARGERLGMIGMGGGAGFLASGGNPWGAVGGAIGGYLQENPQTGKRGYQETWKYELKPMYSQMETAGKKYERGMNKFGKGDVPGGLEDLYSGFHKSINFKNAWDSLSSIGKVGGGPKPPSKWETQQEIAFKMARNTQTDIGVRGWWDAIASKGGEAGREYVLSSKQTEGRESRDVEGMPEWLQGTYGKHGQYSYDYRPQFIGDQQAAPTGMSRQLAALQGEYERMGNKKKFYETYMKDYDFFKKGGSGIKELYKGKTLYDIPSEVGGSTFEELFPDLDTTQGLSDYEWAAQQEEEVEV